MCRSWALQAYSRVRSRRSASLLLAGLLLTGTASIGAFTAPATAAPGDPPPPLSMRELGSSPTVAFPGQQGEVSLSLAVPQGLTPTEISGTAQFPTFVTGGTVDVLQEGRLISRTPIDAAVNSPIASPLRGIRVERSAADLVLRTYLRTAGSCLFDDRSGFSKPARSRLLAMSTWMSGFIQSRWLMPVHGPNSTVSYAGREATPESVADFLPPILRKLTIFVPEDVQPAEGAAAVALATAVVANYGSATVDVEVASMRRGSATPGRRSARWNVR